MEWWQILLIVLGSVLLLLVLSIVFYKPFFKRFWDIVLSGLAIVVLSPLLLVMIVVGSISMHGNPFFTQERPGKKERLFKLIKFRSMNNRKDETGKLLPDKDRLTGYGLFIRKTSLDELPELLNIFIGDMSFIGPRPLMARYLNYYNERERHRHDVRPGLTGFAQIKGRNEVDWGQRINFDLTYVESLSFWFDLKILFETVIIVFKGEGTLNDNMENFDDYCKRIGRL